MRFMVGLGEWAFWLVLARNKNLICPKGFFCIASRSKMGKSHPSHGFLEHPHAADSGFISLAWTLPLNPRHVYPVACWTAQISQLSQVQDWTLDHHCSSPSHLLHPKSFPPQGWYLHPPSCPDFILQNHSWLLSHTLDIQFSKWSHWLYL